MGLTKLYMACVEVLKEISVVKLGTVLKGSWVSGLLKHVRDSQLHGRNMALRLRFCYQLLSVPWASPH